MKELEELFCKIHNRPGLYGLFAHSRFGVRQLVQYVSQMLVKKVDAKPLINPTVINPQESWQYEMEICDLNADGITIMKGDDERTVDRREFNFDATKKEIERTSSSIVFIHLSKLLVDGNTFERLKKMAEDFSIPIVVIMYLHRMSLGRKPELLDLAFPLNEWDSEFGNFVQSLKGYESIILYDRDHDVELDLGWLSPSNLSDIIELTVYNHPFGRKRLLKFNINDMFDENKEKVNKEIFYKYLKSLI